MTSERTTDNRVTISGGEFVGSAIGAGEVDNHAHVQSSTSRGAADLDELRALVQQLRSELAQTNRTEVERAVLDDRLDDLTDELRDVEPDSEVISTRSEE
jgi:cell shape-determining protein MreC